MRWLALVAVLLISPTANSDPIVGADDPAYQAARDLWLRDEEQGLRDLISLTYEENDAATILVEGIGSRKYINHSARFHPDLDPFDDLVERSEFAKLFGLRTSDDPDQFRRLADTGEPRRATLLATESVVGKQFNPTLASVIEAESLPADMRYLAVIAGLNQLDEESFFPFYLASCEANWASPEPFEPLAMLCEQTDQAGLQQVIRALVSADFSELRSKHSPRIIIWLTTDSRTRPFRQICKATCGSATEDCIATLFWMSAGKSAYYVSPAETLIPQDEFIASERANGILWRNTRFMLGYFTEWPARLTSERPGAACLLDAFARKDTRWDREYYK